LSCWGDPWAIAEVLQELLTWELLLANLNFHVVVARNCDDLATVIGKRLVELLGISAAGIVVIIDVT
jgi:hypothetical protein